MFYYQHHVGDYRRDTGHLTLLEHGIYRQLLDLYYITERPLDSSAMRLICVRTTDEKEAYQRVLADFFYERDGKFYHKRCDFEIVKFKDKSTKAISSAKSRWNKNNDLQDANASPTHSEQDADGMLTNKPTNQLTNKPINQLKTKTVAQSACNRPEGVLESLWEDFVTLRKAKKAPLTASALKGIEREAKKAGMNIEEALYECCSRGWTGFKAEWIKTPLNKYEKFDPVAYSFSKLQNTIDPFRSEKDITND